MALGSSAPEIMLSCIELLGNGFKAGELGPSTIVGSAAFNLLMILAICVVCIPNGASRRIKARAAAALPRPRALLASSAACASRRHVRRWPPRPRSCPPTSHRLLRARVGSRRT